jgi:hypothetical protein
MAAVRAGFQVEAAPARRFVVSHPDAGVVRG